MTQKPLSVSQAAAITVSAVDGGQETLVFARLDPLPAVRMVIVAKPDRSAVEVHGSLGEASLDERAKDRAMALLAGRLQEGEVDLDGTRLYVEAHRPVAELIIVGAGHISLPLAAVGHVLGLRVRVLDDRPEFARQERFPDHVEVRHVDFARAFEGIAVGPLTHVVLVTRGHKYDYECLLQLLRLPVTLRYIGMIGSRRRVRATWVQLLEEGIDRERIRSIRAPVGLDLGAQTPGEIAVAVAAEIVREWRGGTGDPLREQERILDRFFLDVDEEDLVEADLSGESKADTKTGSTP